MMDVPTAQEKSEQIFFAQPKAHQNKFADLNKMVPEDPQFPDGRQTALKLPLALANTTKSSTRVNLLP